MAEENTGGSGEPTASEGADYDRSADVGNGTDRRELWMTVRPRATETVLGIVLILVWLTFFVVGIVVPTQVPREAILESITAKVSMPAEFSSPVKAVDGQQSSASTKVALSAAVSGTPSTSVPIQASARPRKDLSWWALVGYASLVAVAFTVTNLYFLALIAAFLGCMARRWSTEFDNQSAGRDRALVELARLDVRRVYITAVLRGFLAYVLVIAGYLLVVPESSLNQMSPGQFIRLAGSVSTLAFLVGYEPSLVGSLLDRVFTNNGKNRSANGEPQRDGSATARSSQSAVSAGAALKPDEPAPRPDGV